MSRIWDEACRAAAGPGAQSNEATVVPFRRLRGTLLRCVESQEQVATNSLVDTAAEQRVLEELLERSKPPLRAGSEGMPYLLQTPFRYPPLPHGSRFGSRFEPSIFYGSRELGTVLAETAFYRFWFWSGMATPPSRELTTQHSVFKAGYATRRGIRLQAPPFAVSERVLRDPADYRATQALGAAMRVAGVEAFEYLSARDPERGINVGVMDPAALSPRDRILGREEWTCCTGAARVVFISIAGGVTREFPRELFLEDGELPSPA
ncbi:RES family NAD+ phosphorylase [Thioalkalivibrio sp. XN8]|uniref:RES family NAD+ phosphorylase n=1 Tax=Thioalkalivibrio sp. XN8 TaxID=2712863 RepID=UPI0013EBB4C9|nr:RES family NAD+ phosphorylase [Thioalkalivibrio sp. XN8]NGP53731.1 RES family NAD+ phosphorylase [Thioalkalivibrio sp. XN8]